MLCVDEDNVKVGDIRDVLSMTAGTFSKYRDKLIKTGILLSESHGYISLALPRFNEVAKML